MSRIMKQKEFERLAKLEQSQTDSIRDMDKHVEEDHRVLGEIKENITDIYDKLSRLLVGQAETRTTMQVMGWVVVLLTPVVTAVVVVIIELIFFKR
jgi:hypothetical protein